MSLVIACSEYMDLKWERRKRNICKAISGWYLPFLAPGQMDTIRTKGYIGEREYIITIQRSFTKPTRYRMSL